MSRRWCARVAQVSGAAILVASTLVATPTLLHAQQRVPDIVSQWLSLEAPPGDEHLATAIIRAADARWKADEQGNLVKRVGSGRPRRVIACGIDRVGYVVSSITDAGYLRVHRVGTPSHPLWDQAHEAQQILVRTAQGRVPGVVAVPNGHFARQHRGDTAVVNVDQLWIDVGASSRAEVARLGIELMDPVRRDVPPWQYADFIAGADASGRAGCAALAAVSNAPAAAGETNFVISTRRATGWHGLTGALARLGDVDRIVLVGPAPPRSSDGEAVRRSTGALAFLGSVRSRPDTVTSLSLRARWAGSHVESVSAADVDALRGTIAELAGVEPARATWLALDAPPARPVPRRDAYSDLAESLRRMADLPGVPGHEFRVREAVRAALPEWARSRAIVDSVGNLYFSVGPARDTVVAVAHMDEVSFTVAGIQRDGTVQLTARGGVIPSAWEGQPALLHFDAGARDAPPLPGIFVPRDTASVRAPRGNSAFFGLDSAALVARGVRVGQGVTAYKRAQRLAGTRFTGRAMDDRAGSTALVAAVSRLDTTRLDHAVVFAWSVAEEGGLVGAGVLARRFGPTVRRVYAVDTFVTSDTPLEQPTFAYTPLGAGAVLRALDDGLIASRAERERVVRIARAARIPLQVGTTHGSTDATAFARWGALGAGLSWPGRYSHSPGEVLDLRDLDALARLIRAVVSAPAR